MKTYEYILFDWDGCLAETLDIWMDAYKQSLEDFSLSATDKEIAAQFGDWEGPKKLGISDNDYESYIARLMELVNEKLPKVKLYPGARKLLESLRKNDKNMALITSSKKANIKAALHNNDLEKYFDVILAAEDVENHKPHPEVIEKSLDMLNGAKDKAVIIGDSSKDLEAAQNANIDSILVYPNSHKTYYDLEKLKDYKPTYILDSLGKVRNII